MTKIYKALFLLLFCALLIVGIWYIKDHAAELYGYTENFRTYLKNLAICCPMQAMLLYVTLYIGCAIVAIPILMPLTLFGGMLFGTVIGSIAAIISSTVGALISFLLIKKFFLSFMSVKYESVNQEIHSWIGQRGIFSALVVLHLLTVVPYVVINTIAAIMGVSIPLFIAAALFGSTPVMVVYAFVGAQLGTVQSVKDMLSPTFLVACFLLICCIVVPSFFYKTKKQ